MAAEPIVYRANEVPTVFPIGKTTLFELLKTGEIESFKVGRARFVPRQSLLDFMDRQIAEQTAGTQS